MINIKKVTRIVLPLAGGMVIGRLTAKAQNDYKHYEKSPFSPPAKVFPIVWPLLYTSMGVAYQLSYAHAAHKREKQSITRAHYAQLGLNYAWTILYFNLKLRKTSLIESYVLLAAGNITAHRFYASNKYAGLLMLPYVIWLSYASYLNGGNLILNEDKPGYTRD